MLFAAGYPAERRFFVRCCYEKVAATDRAGASFCRDSPFHTSGKELAETMIDTANLGKRIAEARRGRGLTQKDLANKVSVTAQAVSKWERGSACPDISILDEIAEALDVSISDLLGVK